MCDYVIIAQSTNGIIRFCKDCKTYVIIYNNLIVNYDHEGFIEFKDFLSTCYEHHRQTKYDPHFRYIHFNTLINGMKLLYSLAEVGELLSLFQKGHLNNLSYEDLDKSHL